MIEQYNIAANTQIGMVRIPTTVHAEENRRHNDNWERAGAFFEDYHTHDWIMIGKRWFNLPGIIEMKHHVQDFFTNVLEPSVKYGFEGGNWKEHQGLIFDDPNGRSPLIFEYDTNNQTVREWRNYVETHPNQSY